MTPSVSDVAADWLFALTVGARPGHDRVAASLLALSDGTASMIGDVDGGAVPEHFVLATGAYGVGSDGLVRPLPGPVWTTLDGVSSSWGGWILDLRSGVLFSTNDDGVSLTRFQSIARPGVGCLHLDHATGFRHASPVLRPPSAPTPLIAIHRFESGAATTDGIEHAATVSDRSAVTVAVAEQSTRRGEHHRIAATVTARMPAADTARAAVSNARRVGYRELLAEHRRSWEQRWNVADIEISGDPNAQRAVRYALFHLLSCASTSGESAVGARGLTGLAYAGHVFWDTDVFVLPALAATLPAAARSVLEYRIRRISAAREQAAGRGRPGLRFPWESADDGSDVTPSSAVDIDGTTIPIRTGQCAEHINSDVAWSIDHYLSWTGDQQVLDDGGRELIIGTAAYLAGRTRTDRRGIAHLDRVIGPDEYHPEVDDNAYTNGMARWHLRRAAALAADDPTSAQSWMRISDALVTGYDRVRGCHEQFVGFSSLDDVLISEIAVPPVAADVLLGPQRVAQTQIIKQPDVLMLQHLLPDQCPAGSLAGDLDFYLPRTAHGSSLSPAICAALLARAGRADEALELFDLAARLDLDDLTGTTAGGLHLATMGGLWQAVVFGFAGIRPTPDALAIEPRLPARWKSLAVTLVFREVRARITIDAVEVSVVTERPIPVLIDGRQLTAPVTTCRSSPPAPSPVARAAGGVP